MMINGAPLLYFDFLAICFYILYSRNKYPQLRLRFGGTEPVTAFAQQGALFSLTFIEGLLLVRRALASGGLVIARAVMKPDLDKYLPWLEGYDLTHEEKIELIRTVGGILQNFVDRAFGRDAHQLCRQNLDGAHSIYASKMLELTTESKRKNTISAFSSTDEREGGEEGPGP